MGVHSGKFGTIDGINTVRQWSINDAGETKPYVASNTLGGTGRRRGNEDWSGTANCYGCRPPVMPGDPLAFVGYTAPSDDVEGSNGARYSGDAMVNQVAISWNWEAGDPLSYVLNFEGNGVLSGAPGAAVPDATFPDVPVIIGRPMLWGAVDAAPGSSEYEELDDVQSASLTITTANPSYVNSSTSGGTRRKAGNVDWTLAITMHNEGGIDLPFSKGDLIGVLLPSGVDDEYWDLRWGIVKDFTGITVDREGGAIISATINIEMAGFDHDNEEVGHIIDPDGNSYWPAA